MSRARRVLLVEDDAKVASVVRLYLESDGFEVSHTGDGRQALALCSQSPFDLILLDLMLPGLDGLTVCRRLREGSSVPIIMLTAKTTEQDRIRGLELGADDYVPKPFSPRELLARVRAVLRRSGNERDPEILRFDGLTIDTGARTVHRDLEPVTLTPAQFGLLAVMARSPGRAFSREELIERAFGPDYEGHSRTVDAHVKDLRHRLKLHAGEHCFIETVFGFGYRFLDPGKRPA